MGTAYNRGSKSVEDWIKHHHSDFAAVETGHALSLHALSLPIAEGNPSATSFMKFQAFTTAAVQDQRVRTRIQAALAGNLKRGENKEDFRKVIDAEFDRAGLTKLNPGQISNIYYTNTSLAFGAGQMGKMIEVSADFPYWKYSATMDSKTRPDHAALHGKIFRTGDFTFWPPIGFRCRCTSIPLTARQAGKLLESKVPLEGGQRHSMPTPEELKELRLSNAGFIGNKQQNYMQWIGKEYAKADEQTRGYIDKAFDAMKRDIKAQKESGTLVYYTDILNAEDKIRKNKSFETAVVFDQNGNEIFRKKGKATSVPFTLSELSNFKNSIFTHNHPRGWSYNANDWRRIGSSFSFGDVNVAIVADVAEMRAVTSLYTFSIKRPKNGWKMTSKEAKVEFEKINSEITNELKKVIYAAKGSHINKRVERAEALHYHLVWKRFCKKFGIEYSKVRSK